MTPSTSRPLRVRYARDARILKLTLAAALLVSLGVFHIWSRTRVLASGYALGELTREHQRLSTEHDRLRIEVETLRSPAALERFARTTLGMAPPAPGAVWAASPRLASATAGTAGGDGVGHRRNGPAEPPLPSAPLSTVSGQGGRGGNRLLAVGGRAAGSRAAAARDVEVPGERFAFRGPLRAGRAPRRELP
jgi:cell division protein FtsL